MLAIWSRPLNSYGNLHMHNPFIQTERTTNNSTIESTFELQVIWDAMTLILRHGNAWAFLKPSLHALKVVLNDGVRGHETDRMETYHSNL